VPESRRTYDGLCVLHGIPISVEDGICTECRERNAETAGDYLRWFGRGGNANGLPADYVPTVFLNALSNQVDFSE
jgi:hypothetical protein